MSERVIKDPIAVTCVTLLCEIKATISNIQKLLLQLLPALTFAEFDYAQTGIKGNVQP